MSTQQSRTTRTRNDQPAVPMRIQYLRKFGVTYWDHRTKTFVSRTYGS